MRKNVNHESGRKCNFPWCDRAWLLIKGLSKCLFTPKTLRPGLQVLASASHYWPLDAVDGIHELWDQIGNRPGYVNGSNISMCINKQTVDNTRRNAPAKCLAPCMVSSFCFSITHLPATGIVLLNVLLFSKCLCCSSGLSPKLRNTIWCVP